jgi:excisionase family DNA binding protein
MGRADDVLALRSFARADCRQERLTSFSLFADISKRDFSRRRTSDGRFRRGLAEVRTEQPRNGEESMTTNAPARLLRTKEVGRILGVTPERVRELVSSGELASVRLGSQGQGWHRFRPEDVERLIAGKQS